MASPCGGGRYPPLKGGIYLIETGHHDITHGWNFHIGSLKLAWRWLLQKRNSSIRLFINSDEEIRKWPVVATRALLSFQVCSTMITVRRTSKTLVTSWFWQFTYSEWLWAQGWLEPKQIRADFGADLLIIRWRFEHQVALPRTPGGNVNVESCGHLNSFTSFCSIQLILICPRMSYVTQKTYASAVDIKAKKW